MSTITPQLVIARWFADSDDPSEADMLNAGEVIATLRAAGFAVEVRNRATQGGWEGDDVFWLPSTDVSGGEA